MIHLNMNMMMTELRHKYQFIQNAAVNYYISFQFINQFKVQQDAASMYLGTFENDQYFGQAFPLLEKSQFLDLLHPSNEFRNGPLQTNFDEVFLTSIAPNCSNISICTQEDRSYETFSIADQFFGDSIDHFFHDSTFKATDYHKPELLPRRIFVKQEHLFESEKEEDLKKQLDNEEGQKQQKEGESQNCHDETKNIPKNYIKAIFGFILENDEYVERMLDTISEASNIQLDGFLEFVKLEKRTKKYTIERLKNLWTNPSYGKAMRIISCQFLRKRSLGYIFGSKIQKKMSHVRHRFKIMRAIENPTEFTNIK